jgi:hypothetical protein
MRFRAPPAQTLKHLPFFEVLAAAPEDSPEALRATAGLLSLRMLDHWVLAGPAIVEPESVSVRSVRKAIMALPASEPAREALLTTVNTMQMLRQVDLVPVLPRVFAYAQLLERHYGSMALAADAYSSVVRLADADFDAELVMDSYANMAFCQRRTGALTAAAESSTALARLAGRKKDRARVLRAKIGLGLVTMARGDLAAADTQFADVAVEAEQYELTRELSMALHNRAVVASRNEDQTRAIVLAHAALKSTFDPIDRDRVLADLSAFLIKSGRYEAAIDALRILELTAASEEPRRLARANIVIAAARWGKRDVFDASRQDVDAEKLTLEARVNFHIESARGLANFGRPGDAEEALTFAENEARENGLTNAIREIDEVRAGVPVVVDESADEILVGEDPAGEVVVELRAMAAALAA